MRRLAHLPTVPAPREADSAPVTDDRATRGLVIKERRKAHGIRSVNMFADVAPFSRPTLARAEGGLASEETYTGLERYLDKLDKDRGIDSKAIAQEKIAARAASAESDAGLDEDVIEVEVTGPSTQRNWHVVFRAHPEHVDLITEQAAKLLRGIESDD